MLCVIAPAYISFRLRRPDETADDDMDELQSMETKQVRRRQSFGFLDYHITQIHPFDTPEHLPVRDELDSDRRLVAAEWRQTLGDKTIGSLQLRDVISNNNGGNPIGILCISNTLGELLIKGAHYGCAMRGPLTTDG